MAPSLLVVLSVLMSLSCVSRGFMPPKATATEGPAVSAEPPPSVVLNRQGKVTGSIQKSDSGREYNAFYGIPFGTILKRFTPAVPAGPFPEDFVANKKSDACPQTNLMGGGVAGTEDCLSLHVYTPYLPASDSDTKLPVLVWIYGGAFRMGSVSPTMHGPSHLMEHDIVLVMMNYRVGLFGFLATGDAASPGNYGLQDQNLALQWVQENVEQFGGDKNQVTISGLSAGGASVIFQILSPLSYGLFHRAIAMSGSALGPWPLINDPLKNAKHVAALLKCPTDDTYELVECLRSASVEDIVNATEEIWVAPSVEPENGGRFLTEHPYRLLLEGRFNKVPLMSGITRDEMAIAFVSNDDPTRYKNITKDEFYVKKLFSTLEDKVHKKYSKDEKNQLRAIAEEYFRDVDFANETAVEIADIQYASDALLDSSNDLTIKMFTSHDLPVYSYRFDYISDILQPTSKNGREDVKHGSDFGYLFAIKMLLVTRKYSSEDMEFIRKYIALLTNFVSTSNPTPSGELIWEPTPRDENHYLRLKTEMEMSEEEHPKRMAMWNDFFISTMKPHMLTS